MHYVTSDLHGYPLEKFLALLEKANFSAADELYVLGDVIDRNGDGGVETLLWMMQQENVTLLLGNHEEFPLACEYLFSEITEDEIRKLGADKLMMYAGWLRNGGDSTIRSLRKLAEEDRETFTELMEYLRAAPLYDILKLNGKVFLLVHAGLGNYAPDKETDEYSRDELLWTRPELEDAYYPGVRVVFGHTPTAFYGPQYKDRMIVTDSWIDIDTGAAGGGSPMLLRLEDEEAFYVE